MSEIININEDWQLHSGAEVQVYIKKLLGDLDRGLADKIGCLRTYEDEDEELHLVGFASLEDYNTWFDNHGAITPITDIVIPKGGGAETAYSLVLEGTAPAAVQMNSDFTVRLKANYTYNSGGASTPMTDPVTLTIQSSTNNQNWTMRGQVVIDPNRFENVSMKGILPSGNLYVRITASTYDASSPVPFTFRVNIVNLSLTPATPFHMPFDPANPMTLLFYMTGNISKSLLLKFDGGGQGKELVIDNITEVYTDTAYTVIVQNLSSEILTSGRHIVEAQLKYSESVHTDWILSEYLVIGAVEPVIAINNIAENLANWTDVRFFDWAVYTPDGSPMSVVFRLVDSEHLQEYANARWPKTTEAAVSNSLAVPLAIDGVEDTWIDALMLIEDSEGNELHEPIAFGMENESSFAPTPGASFVLTPSVRSNGDADRATILNTVNGDIVAQAEDFVGFDWQTDGWIDANIDGSTVRVLRIPAGRQVTIHYNPMMDFTSGNSTGRSMVWELDFVVRNVVDDLEPLLTLGTERNNGVWWGFKMLPLSAMMLTADHYTEADQDLSWAEDRRFHLAITAQFGGEGNPNYIRIYLNGSMEREFAYDVSDRFTPEGANIVIGNTGSDIDIVGMRGLRMALSSVAVSQDYKASMSTTQEKATFALANDILDDMGRIDWDKCLGKYNRIGHRGRLLHYGMENNTQKNISLVIDLADDEEHSGTLTELENKGQGTTAMGYFWWNQQYKITKQTQFLDSDGNPKQDTGKGYAIKRGEAKAKKLVGKVNFASSMQSHKLGLTWAYTDVFKQMLEDGSLVTVPSQMGSKVNGELSLNASRLAVFEKPFLFFVWDEENSRWDFRNLMTFGAGKGDKPTFGFSEDDTPHMLMVEGADNDKPLARFNMPWDDTNISYDADKETWNYNGVKNINFGFGLTDDDGVPNDAEALASIRRFFNFVYLHSTKMDFYTGTLDALQRVEGSSLSPLRWLTSNYQLYRYDDTKPAGQHWVPAGIDNQPLNLRDQYEEFTGTSFNTSQSNANKNNAFKKARLDHFKAHVDDIIHVEDMLYHYCFILLFAGTDNRAKNTYYYTDPNGTTITDPITGETVIHHKIRWMQDDLDTVLKTNNVGQNRKPYWVETHTKDERGENYWMAEESVLNCLIEEAWDKDKDEGETYNLQRTMRNMLAAMSKLGGGSVMGFFEKYLLSTQDYFPAAAYNEMARVVYEYTYRQKVAGNYDNVDPLTQSCGSQRWSEYQWLLDRYMFISSWCQYGEFASATSAGGLLWAGATGTHYFTVTPAKWLYPRVAVGSSNEGGTELTPPGTPHAFNGVQSQGDTRLYIRGPHYLWKLGDMDQLQSDNGFTFSGRRLQEITVNPAGTNNPVRWSAQAVATTATNIKRFIMRNIPAVSGTLDLSQCVRLEEINVEGTSFTAVKLPSTGSLKSLTLPATLEALSLVGLRSLEDLAIGGYASMTEVAIKDSPLADSLYIVQQVYGNTGLKKIDIDSVDWRLTGAAGLALLNALAALGSSCKLQGTVTLVGVTPGFEDKLLWLQAWGDVDSGSQGLTIVYPQTQVENVRIITGKYLESLGEHQMRMNSEGNDFKTVEWSITRNNYATIDPVTSVVTVSELTEEAMAPALTVTVRVTRVDGTVLEDQKDFYPCVHICREGDYVYADGSFSDELVSYKTVVALCFYINPDNPADRLAVSRGNVTWDMWGLYDDASYGVRGVTVDGYSSVYNTPVIDISSNGTGDIDNVAAMTSFKNYGRSTAVGDVGFVELTEDIGPFSTGDFIHVGQYKTLQIIRHRNRILNGVTSDVGSHTPKVPVANANQTETEVLTTLIADIVSKKGNNYREFYYPAASFCYAYQPTYALQPGEVLADKFRAHNWWLPTLGELGMVYWQQVKGGIFAAAQANGRYTVLQNDYLWTSTEYNASNAWNLHGGNGQVYFSNFFKYYSRAVRAVVAF